MQIYTYTNPGVWTEDLGTDTVRLGEIPGFVTMADLGAVGTSQIILDNPDGTVGHLSDQITGLRELWVDEDAEGALNQRIYTGLIADRTYRRGSTTRPSLRTGPANEIEINLSDQNERLGRRIITDTDGSRPSETVGARLAWLLASSYLSGLVFDNGFVASSSVVMDAADYTGQKPADVLADLALATHFNYFVYYDEVADQASLWFDDFNTSLLWDSGISISNDLADIDQAAILAGTATVFYPLDDAELRRDPARVYSGAYLPYQAGHVYVTDGTISAAFVARDGSAPNSNIKTAAAATVVANNFLADSSSEEDRITCTILPMAAQVNAVKAGQLVQFKSTDLPGYSAYRPMRVLQRTVAQTDEQNTRYQVTLVLSPACPTATIVQSGKVLPKIASGTEVIMPFTAIAGDLLVMAIKRRGGTVFAAPTGWTIIQDDNTYTTYTTGTVGVCYRVADGTEQINDEITIPGGVSGANQWIGFMWEFGAADSASIVSSEVGVADQVCPPCAHVKTGTGIAVAAGTIVLGIFTSNYDNVGPTCPGGAFYTVGAPWVEDWQNTPASTPPVPQNAAPMGCWTHQIVSGAGTYAPAATTNDTNNATFIIAVGIQPASGTCG